MDEQTASTTTPSQKTVISKANEQKDITLLEANSQVQIVAQNDKADSIQAEVIDQEPLGGDQNTIRKQPVTKLRAESKIKTNNFKKAIAQRSKFYMVKRKKKKKKNYGDKESNDATEEFGDKESNDATEEFGDKESNDATEEFVEECCAIYSARKTYKLLRWLSRHCDCSGDCDCDCCSSDCKCVCDSDDDC